MKSNYRDRSKGMKMQGSKIWTAAIPIILLVFIIGVLISGYLIMFLWNWLLTNLFGLAPISLLQGVGLSLLMSVIGSFFKSAK